MKLGLHAYQMAKNWDLETTVANCQAAGMASFEFFVENGYRQGVELSMPREELYRAKELFARSGIAIAGLAIVDRYDYPEEEKRKAAIEHSKLYVEMARDIGAPRLRCLGDVLHEDVEKPAATVSRVARSLRELALYAERFNVDIGFEMHNKFSPWELALAVVREAEHPRVYLVHNGQPANTPPEIFDQVFKQIRPHLGHVHFHDFLDPRFPYRRFIRALKDSGYQGYCSLELAPSEDPIRVLKLTRALFEAYQT